MDQNSWDLLLRFMGENNARLSLIEKDIKDLSKFHWKIAGGVFTAVLFIEGLQSFLHL